MSLRDRHDEPSTRSPTPPPRLAAADARHGAAGCGHRAGRRPLVVRRRRSVECLRRRRRFRRAPHHRMDAGRPRVRQVRRPAPPRGHRHARQLQSGAGRRRRRCHHPGAGAHHRQPGADHHRRRLARRSRLRHRCRRRRPEAAHRAGAAQPRRRVAGRHADCGQGHEGVPPRDERRGRRAGSRLHRRLRRHRLRRARRQPLRVHRHVQHPAVRLAALHLPAPAG